MSLHPAAHQDGGVVGDGGIRLMTDAGDHRDPRCADGPGQALAVEAPQVLERSPTAHQQDDIHIAQLLSPFQSKNQRVFGAVTLLMLEEGLSRVTEYWQIIVGPLLLFIVIYAHGGIDGILASLRRG